jgi:hypothetical protein
LQLGLAVPDRADEPERVWRVGARTVRTTALFDVYWRFAAERQEVLFRRLIDALPPWTADPVLQRHRFTNAYRASDRASQYLISKVIYRGDQDPAETVFRILVFRLFNRVETWQLLERELSLLAWESYEFAWFDAVLSAALATGERVYSQAYVLPPPPFGMGRKHQNHLKLVEHMMAERLPERVAEAPNLRAVYDILRSFPAVGPFLAYQLAIDLNYSTVVNHGEDEFVVAAPGTRTGIALCFRDTGGLTEEELIRWTTESAPQQFERLELTFRELWSRPLQLVDCQNLFSQTEKYLRAGRKPRGRQVFTPTQGRIIHRYPPKWGLPAEVTASLPGAAEQASD